MRSTGLIAGSLLDANNNSFIPDIPVAFDTKVMSASNDIKYQAKLPIATEAPRGRPAQ